MSAHPPVTTGALGSGDARLAALLEELRAYPQLRVLQRFSPVREYAQPDGEPMGIAMVLDTETTGKDPTKDRVFELGFVLVEYGVTTGRLFRIVDEYNGLNDPGFPLPAEIEKLTGATYAEVQGKCFDDERVNEAIARADIVVAQNASFDRRFVEPIYPAFKDKPWACSVEEGPWEAMNISIKKQEFLAYRVAGVFYDAHRALTDCQVLLHILSCAAPDGRTIFSHVLESARKPSYRVWATGSSFDKKNILKDSKYSWSSGEESEKLPKVWYRERTPNLDAEIEFLAREIYAPAQGRITVDFLTARERYSYSRYLERKTMMVGNAPAASTRAARP